MANRYMYQTGTHKPLLPATESRDPSDYGDDGSGGSGGAGKQLKRAKVTAVACQPCQKRKSKCDGMRPVCTSCQQKGRTDCVYDSASDLRRTSALKQQIDGLQQQVNDLMDILLAVCAAHNTGNSDAVLGVVRSVVGSQDFAGVPELAEVLRNNRGQLPAARIGYQQQGLSQENAAYSQFSHVPHGFGEGQPMATQHGMQAPSAIDPQIGWPVDEEQSEGEEDPRQRSYHGQYM